MSDVIYEGKRYKDIDLDAQRALKAVNIFTFRYFPLDRVWMASDLTAEEFKINKFYKIALDGTGGPDIIFPADKEKDLGLYRKAINGEDTCSEQLRFYDGESYYKMSLSVLEKNGEGKAVTIAGVIETYDERMKMTEFVKTLSDDYDSAYEVNFAKDEVVVFRMSNFINSAYGDKLTKRPSYADMINSYIDKEVVEEERDEMKRIVTYEHLQRVLKEKRVFMHDFRVLSYDKPTYIRLKVVNISDGDKLEKAVMGFANVNSEKLNEWRHLAYEDPITTGYNYTYFSEKLKQEDNEGYIVSLDIRAFKLINSVCGINKGDEVLRRVSWLVDDTIGVMGYASHVNADHFALFLNVKDDESVIKILNSINKGFEKLVGELNIPKIEPYFGVTKWQPGARIQVKFSEANTAKHRIKDTKKEFYGFYRDEDTQAAVEVKKMEEAFDGAIAKKQFEVWYQPKYSPVDGKMTGAEALVRWRGEDGNLISPGKFIPVFETNGMIRRLDEYVFTTVCEQQKQWMDEYGKIIPISINLSRASLYYENIVEMYKEIAEQIGVTPEFLPIEITESAAIDNEDIRGIAKRFDEAGFPLHMDDFGTGYSSLSTLNMMKFDTLKLDKSLIDFIGEFGGDRLLKHTVALAKDLGINVTAEGVEKEDQVVFLRDIQCDSIQGFFYSRPLPLSEFNEKLESVLK